MKTPTALLLTLPLLGSLSYPAVAADDERVRERWLVTAGAFLVREADTVIRLDSTDGIIGTTINFNEDLSVDNDDNTGKIDGYWRFNNHHMIRADWYNIERTGQRNIDIDINFGDQFFQVNTDLLSRFKTNIFDVMYQYSFYNTEKVELGVQGGFHITDIEVALQEVGGTGPVLAESASSTAPLPVFGFVARYNFFPKLSVSFNWKSLELEIGDYGGNFKDVSLVAEHRTFKHFGFGIGLQRFDFAVTATDPEFTGSFDNRWDGFYLYFMGY